MKEFYRMREKSKLQAPTTANGLGLRARKDCGQVVMFVMIGMAAFLLGFIGLGVDMTNLWLHHQTSQNAADAACVAGAMDMLSTAQGVAMGGSDFQSALQAGTALDCASASGAAPCQYAA